MQTAAALSTLNFALAGAREGFGPFLGVYLQQIGLDPAATGTAMSLAGLAGVLATTPIGALIDGISGKRTALAVAVLLIATGALALIASRSLWLIGASQILIGVADASVAPLIAAITLGIVGQDAYGARVASNEAYNHAGNAANAALSGLLGYFFGLSYVTIAIVVMAVASCGVLARLDHRAIDHRVARGGDSDKVSALRVVFGNRRLLLLAGTAFAFEAANGAMLPFIAQARVKAGADASITTGIMVVVAQIMMIAAALGAAAVAKRVGFRAVLLGALVVTVARGLLAAGGTGWAIVGPVQVLEGLAMGLGGVALPTIAAEIAEGTGHANAGLGGVLTMYGAGAAVSPLLAGFVTQAAGFPASFVALAGMAGVGAVVWALNGEIRAGARGVPPARPAERAA